MASEVYVTYYTDPLCSWSWAMEPGWRRLRYGFGDQIKWRYKMGGLVAESDTFEDPVNSVHRPAQWAPQWFEVGKKTGMPLDEEIWHVDQPPDSSYPACVAVKAVQCQGADPAERYLRRLREEVMLRQTDISRREVLDGIAEQIDGLDVEQYRRDFEGPARSDFRDDLRDVGYRELGRFPALVVESAEQRTREGGDSSKLLAVGWRPFDVLRRAVERVAPGVKPLRDVSHPVEAVEAWGTGTPPEVATMCDLALETVRKLLADGEKEGRLVREETTAEEPLFRAADGRPPI